jgi:3-methylcrotonyl-CoA carboxylase alpha subunit
MIAKVIAHGASRDQALDRLAEALDHTVVAGPRSNVAFLAALCRAPPFRSGQFDTGFIDRNLDALGAAPLAPDRGAAAAAVAHLIAREQAHLKERLANVAHHPSSPWDTADAFSLAGPQAVPLAVAVDGRRVVARVTHGPDGASVEIDGSRPSSGIHLIEAGATVYALRNGRQTVVRFEDGGGEDDHAHGDGVIKAPMHGKLLALFVDKGDTVAKGHRVAVIEAMKMEHSLLASVSGTVAEITAATGDQVTEGATVMVIESHVPADEPDA